MHSAVTANSFLKFAFRRVARIYPALAINIIVLEFLVWSFGQSNYSNKNIASIVWYEIVYIVTASDGVARNFVKLGAAARDWTGFLPFYPSGVLWTLSVEISFYLLVPVLVFISRNRFVLATFIVLLAIASFGYSSTIGVSAENFSNYLLSISVLPYFWIFAVGGLVRIFLPSSRVSAYLAIGLSAVYFAYIYSRGMVWLQWKYNPEIQEFVQVLLLSLMVVFVGTTKLFKSRLLSVFDVSYGVYLYHMLVIAIFAGFGFINNSWMLIPVYTLSVSIGILSWILVERRSIDFASQKKYAAEKPDVFL